MSVVAASVLNTIDSLTTTAVEATGVTEITGTASAIATAMGSSGINDAADVTATIGSGEAEVSDLLDIAELTTSVVSTSAVTSISGTKSLLSEYQQSDGFTGQAVESFELVHSVDNAVIINSGLLDVYDALSNKDDFKFKIKGNSAINDITGAALNDSIWGYGNADTLSGGAGKDKLYGGKGKDVLTGGAGKDVLKGGSGIDIITGGTGKDILTGGGGADKFVYQTLTDSLKFNMDVIKDFKVGVDKIIGSSAVSSSSVNNLSSATSMNNLKSFLTDSVFEANGAATFTCNGNSYLAINDSVAGYKSSTDAIIKITGYQGSLENLAIDIL